MKEVATPLAHIVNLSLSHGIDPHDMKLAKIVPIFKNGNTKLFNNYRPISILPAFSKILEKIVCNRLLHFLETKIILYKPRHEFRKNHNTIHPIIHLLKDIANSPVNLAQFSQNPPLIATETKPVGICVVWYPG